MRLLLTTQALDENDPSFSFAVGWVREFAKHYEHIDVVCLKEGAHTLPENVAVHSLGKERGTRWRISYALRFLILAWKLRNEYDAVFVHMNQDYVLIAGILWE